MSRLPVEFLYLCMPPAVFSLLSNNTKAIKCCAKVTWHCIFTRGIPTPWKTGTSVNQFVNSDMMIYGVSAFDLNLSLETSMWLPGAALSNSAMVTSNPTEYYTTDHRKMIEKYRGVAIYQSDNMTKSDSIPRSMGVPWHKKCYDFIRGSVYACHTTKYLNTYLFKSHMGMPIISYDYECKNGCDDFKTYISALVDSMIKIASSMGTDLTDRDEKQVAIKLHNCVGNSEYDHSIKREWGARDSVVLPTRAVLSRAWALASWQLPSVLKESPAPVQFQEVAAFFPC